LRWLAENVLFKGMSEESVWSLFGEGPQVTMEYAAGNHVLVIHANAQEVTSWEWKQGRRSEREAAPARGE
jgi:hypothetical protein